MWDSKYLVSVFPRRHCDHQCHNGNPDEEHMQLLSLNKISQFPLHPGTMGLSPGRWLSSYSPGAIIAAKPLPHTTLTHFSPASLLRLHQPSWDLFTQCSHNLLLSSSLYVYFSLFNSLPFSVHLWYSSSDSEERARDTCFLRLILIWSISGYFQSVTPPYWCEAQLHQNGNLAAVETVCQGAVLIMRDFEVVCCTSHEAGWIPLLGKRSKKRVRLKGRGFIWCNWAFFSSRLWP